jgi:hypothetical protein
MQDMEQGKNVLLVAAALSLSNVIYDHISNDCAASFAGQ